MLPQAGPAKEPPEHKEASHYRNQQRYFTR